MGSRGAAWGRVGSRGVAWGRVGPRGLSRQPRDAVGGARCRSRVFVLGGYGRLEWLGAAAYHANRRQPKRAVVRKPLSVQNVFEADDPGRDEQLEELVEADAIQMKRAGERGASLVTAAAVAAAVAAAAVSQASGGVDGGAGGGGGRAGEDEAGAPVV